MLTTELMLRLVCLCGVRGSGDEWMDITMASFILVHVARRVNPIGQVPLDAMLMQVPGIMKTGWQ